MNASPAAVPSTASTGGGDRAGDLLPALEQDGPFGAERQRGQAVEPPDRLELVAVDDQQVDLVEQSGGRLAAGAAFRQRNRACCGGRRDRLDRDLELAEHCVRRRRPSVASAAALAPGATTIWFSPSSPTTISATPVGSSTPRTPCEVDAALFEQRQRLVGERIVARPRRPSHARAEPRGRQCLVRPLAARDALEGRVGQRLPRPREPLAARDEVEVDRPDDRDRGRLHRPILARPWTSNTVLQAAQSA